MTQNDEGHDPRIITKKIDSIHNIMAHYDGTNNTTNLSDGERISRLTFKNIGSKQSIDVPLESYSDTLETISGDPTSIDVPDNASYVVNNPQMFCIKNATLSSQFGLLVIDDLVARKSTFHFPIFLLDGYRLHGEQSVR